MNMLSWIQKTVFAFSGLSRSLKQTFSIRSTDRFTLLCCMCNVSQFLFLAPDAAGILRYKKDFLSEVLTFIYFKISIEKDFNETRGIRTPDNLIKSKGIQNPKPPRFKQSGMTITYMQNAIVHVSGSKRVRLSLPKQLKEYLKHTYDIGDNYLYLENKIFQNTDVIKQIKIYPPDRKNVCQVIVIYDVKDVEKMQDNGHYLSIDLGLHNLITCYDSAGTSFILGRKYLEISQKYDKEIARLGHQWNSCQSAGGIKYPKPSRHMLKVYKKKRNCIHDYLHKVTRAVVNYCKANDIHTVIIGDITNIRRNKNLGKVTNQKLHALPYAKIYGMLEYKLAMHGITLAKQTEEYSSQCSPHAPQVTKEYAKKCNRTSRGLYKDQLSVYNADAVGAYNIMRKYFAGCGKEKKISVTGLSSPLIIKVAV